MNWERHFRQMRERESVTFGGEVGFGSASPGDVLAYRSLWDAYVMGTLRALGTCADALDALSATPPTGFKAADMQALAKGYRDVVTTTLAQWNQFAGLAPADMLFQSDTMLRAFQNVVKDLGTMRADPQFGVFCPVQLPDPPTADAQKAVIAQAEGAGLIAKGVLDLLVQSASKGLETTTREATSAAGSVASSVIKGIGVPWYAWAAVGLGAVIVLPRVLMPRVPFLR